MAKQQAGTLQKDWDGDRIADWQECVTIFNRYGWEVVATGKRLKDYPHFEKKSLRTRYGTISTD